MLEGRERVAPPKSRRIAERLSGEITRHKRSPKTGDRSNESPNTRTEKGGRGEETQWLMACEAGRRQMTSARGKEGVTEEKASYTPEL